MARPRQFTDAQMLEAAREAFLEQGPGVSTTAIAERLGVSQAALFKRFGTKEGLLLKSMLPDGPPPFVGQLLGGPDPDRPLTDQLAEFGRNAVAFLREMMPRIQCIHAAGLEPADHFGDAENLPPVVVRRLLTTWLEVGRDQGRIAGDVDLETAASALMGAFQFRAFLGRFCGGAVAPEDDGDYVEGVVGALFRGLEPR